VVRPTSLTRQLFAAIGLAALLVNGAQQCHALCLLADCGTEQAPEDKCCQKAARKSCGRTCGNRTTSEQAERCDLSHREGCPKSEQCVCCQTPAPQQAPTPVDPQAVVGSIMAVCNYVGVVFQSPELTGVVCRAMAGSSRSFDVCVKLCRLVV
jgi:hypothetical protein